MQLNLKLSVSSPGGLAKRFGGTWKTVKEKEGLNLREIKSEDIEGERDCKPELCKK